MMMAASLISAPKKLLLFLIIATISLSSCYGNLDMACLDSEKQALLSFKKGLEDPSNRLSSWHAEADCCKWEGVICNNLTGHVHELHLQDSYDADYGTLAKYEAYEKHKLGGEVNPSLLNLKHLSYLDLSQNDFEGISIPSFLGSLTSLRYLNLSEAGFSGTVPRNLGNLSSLQSLGLKGSFPHSDVQVDVENLDWLSNLSTLEHLDLSQVKLNKTPNWLQVINRLPSLVELRLSDCELYSMPPIEKVNFTSLAHLDLSGNEFNGLVPRWIFSLSRLVSLDLADCQFEGEFLENAFVVTKGREVQYNSILSLATSMDLSGNTISGEIPEEITSLLGLRSLNLSGNHLIAVIPKEIGNMVSLESLDLSRNQLSGEIPQSMSVLSFLSFLNVSFNNLSGRIPSSTQLQSLNASSFTSNELCGPPLTQNCSTDGAPPEGDDEEGAESVMEWVYLTAALGFVMGFWVIVGPLLFIRSWRYTYFQFLDKMWNKICNCLGRF